MQVLKISIAVVLVLVKSSAFRGAPCYIIQEVGDSSCLQGHSIIEVSSNSLEILFPVIILNQEDFANVHSVIKTSVYSRKEVPNVPLAR